ARARFRARLRRAETHGRFRANSPVTTLGRITTVHAKLTIIDDPLLRIGSANINNRSMDFDTECDMSFEAAGRAGTGARREIERLRTKLLAHWLGCDEAIMDAAIRKAGAVGAGVEALRNAGYARLRPIEPKALGPLGELVAHYHLGDPLGPGDNWRPWVRKRASANAERRGREAVKAEG